MLLEIERAEYIKDYTLKLYFNNGEIRIADLSASLNGQIFEPLKDLAFFKKFEIKFNTIEWDSGSDDNLRYLR